jgi:nucleoside-diphosphate-sugar epimerase
VRVALTGATGFAGTEAVAEFARRGFETTALVRAAARLDGCQTVVGDLANPGAFGAAVEAAQAVVHLASSRSSARAAVYADVDGTAALLSHWKSGTFVLVSSSVVQRGLESGYALGKLTAEFALHVAPRGGRRGAAVCLRPGVFLGGGPRRNYGQTLGRVFAAARRGSTFVFSSEEALETFGSSFIGTADFARALCAAVTLKESGDFDVAGGFCTWRELVETVNHRAGTRAQFTVRSGPPNGPAEAALPQARCLLDTAKFNAATSFVPQQSLEELVEDYLRSERTTDPNPC